MLSHVVQRNSLICTLVLVLVLVKNKLIAAEKAEATEFQQSFSSTIYKPPTSKTHVSNLNAACLPHVPQDRQQLVQQGHTLPD